MPYVPGLPTLLKSIDNDPTLTPEEKRNLKEDARYFASDGVLTAEEKRSVRDDQFTFGSNNNGATISGPAPVYGTPYRPEDPPASTETSSPVIPIYRPRIRYTPPAPTPPVPPPPPAPPPINKAVKQATPDIVIFDESTVDPGFIVQSFFEEFGGTELVNISRVDLINGDKVTYSPIVNLSEIYRKYNSNNVIAISAYQETPTKYGIDLVARGMNEPYFDNNGNLIIEIDYVKTDESIEVEFAVSGTINRIAQ